MFLKLILFFSILATTQSVSAEEKNNKYTITDVQSVEYSGERLAEAKASGKSTSGYGYTIDGKYSVVDKADLETLLKFRGYKTPSDFVGKTINSPMADPRNALSYEVLLAKTRGRYTPPTEDEFIDKLGRNLINSMDYCPRPEDFIDSQTSLKHARKFFADKASSTKFAEKLSSRLNKQSDDSSVTSITCPDSLTVRGRAECYQIKLNGEAVSQIRMGPYENAGFACKNIRDYGAKKSGGNGAPTGSAGGRR